LILSWDLKACLYILRFKNRRMFKVDRWNIIAWEFSIIQKLKGSYLLLLWVSRCILIGRWLTISSWKTSNIVTYTSLALYVNLVCVSIHLLLLKLLRNMICKLCWLLIVWIYTRTHSFVLLVTLVVWLKRFSKWVASIPNVCVALIWCSLS
jgi:hypothetical protein